MTATKYAVFDLDNCIADDAWRIPQIDWTTNDMDKRYEKYHAQCSADEFINREVLIGKQQSGWKIVIMTARPSTVRSDTEAWLAKSGIDHIRLYMREDGIVAGSAELKKGMMQDFLAIEGCEPSNVVAFDDRQDVLDAYAKLGVNTWRLAIHSEDAYNPPRSPEPQQQFKMADEVMQQMLDTYKQRAALYKANYLMIGEALAKMFPDGITLKTVEDHNKWHLFLMVMVKATRLANTELTHADSGLDMAVYAAMFAGLLMKGDSNGNAN